MKENIICSGALFYSTSTKRFLFLQRTDKKTQGMWGLVGGQAKYSESAFEGLKREIEEEIGKPPKFKKVILITIIFLIIRTTQKNLTGHLPTLEKIKVL